MHMETVYYHVATISQVLPFTSQGVPSLRFGKPASCIKISERPLQFLHHKRDENMKKMNKRKIKGLTSVTLLFS